MSADENGDVVAGPESTPTAAEIMENLQQLNDIEGDLATTAVAVAEAAPEQKEGEVEAPAPTDSVEGAAASTIPEAEPSTATAQNDQAALLQAAQGVENALEQSIPDAPVHDTNVQPDASPTPVSGPVNPEASASSATTPAPAPAQTHSQVDDLIDIVKKDEEPILPIDIASLARLPDSTDADATANADAIAIDQTSGSVDVAPAETHVPDQTLAGQTPLQPTDEGYKPAPVPTPTPEVNGAAGQAVKVEQIQEVAVPQEKLVLPEGLTEKSASVAENRGIAQEWSNDPTNINATLALFNWSIQRSEIQDARAWYAVIAKENPTATQPLLALIDLESTLSNFPQVEALFATTLKAAAATGESAAVVAPDVAIWKAYLHYVRRQNPLVEGPQLEKTRQTITQGYEFALGQCGMDLFAGEIWGEYLAFVQGSNPKNHWEVQAQQDALRKIYQRCVCIPLINLEVIWKQYDAFESSINKATAKQYLAGRSPAYMTARSALRELRSLHDAIRHFSGPVPPKPTFSDNDRQLVGAWKAYLKWEQGNPLVLEPEEVLDERVGYAMKRCLAEMRHFPEMWHLVAGYYLGKDKEERGMAVLKAGVDACPKSVLLTFAAAELAETLKNPTLAHSLFTNLLEHLSTEAASIQSLLERDLVAQMGPEIPKPDSSATRTESNTNGGGNMDVDEDAFAPQSEYTRLVAEREQRGERVKEVRGKEVQEVKDAMGVVWVMYMRFARRAEGIKSARQVFGRARKSVWVSWHPFEASALMEYHSNKDQGVAVRIFELGFKSFPDSPDFIVRYVQFLLSVNDDNNARALFERSTIKMPADKIRPLWDLWAKYEYMYGDLTAVHKLEKRWAEAFPNDSPLRRFAQRYTYDGLDQIALRDLGLGRYNRNQAEAHARGYSGPTAPMPPPADSAPPTSSLQSQATFQPPTPLNAPGNSAPPAIPPHMAASGAPIPPNMAGSGPGPVGGNKRPLGGAPGSQSPSRSHGLARPRGSMERSSSPSRMGMGMGMGYPGAPPPGGGPMPGERENFVPNKRYRANSPRRNDRDRRGGNQGQGQGQGRDRTPLSGAPGPGPVARNFSGAGPGPGAGYGYVPREGYDRSGVGRALAWFVGELPSARSFDGPVFRSDDIVGLFNNIAPDGTRAGPGGGGGGQAPVYAAPMSQQMPPAPMRGGPGYGGPPGGGQGYAPPGGRRY